MEWVLAKIFYFIISNEAHEENRWQKLGLNVGLTNSHTVKKKYDNKTKANNTNGPA
jgi:hypothetical protein